MNDSEQSFNDCKFLMDGDDRLIKFDQLLQLLTKSRFVLTVYLGKLRTT
ncbi:hypothetical protein ACKFKG_23095 [Phormidesmis sp. 146-35]